MSGDLAAHVLSGRHPSTASEARTWLRKLRGQLDPILDEMDADDPEAAQLVRAQAAVLRSLIVLRAREEPPPPVLPDREVLATEVDRLFGWQHLRKYSGMSAEWMDRVRDGIVRVVLARIEQEGRNDG